MPERVRVDNGMDLHSGAFRAACLELKIGIDYVPAGMPTGKAVIERFQGEVRRIFAGVPGVIFADAGADKPKLPNWKRASKRAAVPFSTIAYLIYKWFLDEYSQSWHSGIKAIPANAWRAQWETRKAEFANVLSDEAHIRLVCTSFETRPIHPYGIHLENFVYDSPELQRMRWTIGNKPIRVRYSAGDMSRVWAVNAQDRDVTVVTATCKDNRVFPGMTLFQLRELNWADKEGKQSEDTAAIAASYVARRKRIPSRKPRKRSVRSQIRLDPQLTRLVPVDVPIAVQANPPQEQPAIVKQSKTVIPDGSEGWEIRRNGKRFRE